MSTYGEVIETARLRIRPYHDVEVGYYVAQRYEGRGLVAEAVRACISFAGAKLGAKSFRANCAKDNVRSRMTAAQCGFVMVAEDAEGVRYEFSPPGPDGGSASETRGLK